MTKRPIDPSPVPPAHTLTARFWILNGSVLDARVLGHRNRLSIEGVQPFGRALLFTATGSLRRWVAFLLNMQAREVILLRTS